MKFANFCINFFQQKEKHQELFLFIFASIIKQKATSSKDSKDESFHPSCRR